MSQGSDFLFVGGEFYENDLWESESPTVSSEEINFLNGGKACLIVIADYLCDHKINRILLPHYLCPTILDTLEACGLECKFYQIEADFSIDLDDLERKLTDQQAVYFINYFGFQHNTSTRDYFGELRQKGRFVIEDNAQAGFPSEYIGDFVFNSMRKVCAHDGGYLITPHDISPYLKRYEGINNRRLPIIRRYRKSLREYLFEGKGNFEELLALFHRAERYYISDFVVFGDQLEQREIEQMNWSAIKQVRRDNYQYLLRRISGNENLIPAFPTLQPDNMPLGLPIYVEGLPRDWLNEQLGEHNIGLTIHWEDLLTDPRLNQNVTAVSMASKILTLVTDQYTNWNQLDYLADTLVELTSRRRSY